MTDHDAECVCCRLGPAGAAAKLTDNIIDYGWAVITVPDLPRSFAYTVGLSERGKPELYIEVPVRVMLRPAGVALNALAAMCLVDKIDTAAVLAGQVVSVSEDGKAFELSKYQRPGKLVKAAERYPDVTVIHVRRKG